MKESKRYIQHPSLKDNTDLEISVYYTKGGINYLSGGTTPRGYFIGVKPVTKRDNMVSYVLFSGRRQLLFKTKRFNQKDFIKAVEMAKGYEDALIATVIAEQAA